MDTLRAWIDGRQGAPATGHRRPTARDATREGRGP